MLRTAKAAGDGHRSSQPAVRWQNLTEEVLNSDTSLLVWIQVHLCWNVVPWTWSDTLASWCHLTETWATPVWVLKALQAHWELKTCSLLQPAWVLLHAFLTEKGFFQNTHHLVFKGEAILSLHDITTSCLPFLGTHPSGREGSHAQHLKQHCKILMFFPLFNT